MRCDGKWHTKKIKRWCDASRLAVIIILSSSIIIRRVGAWSGEQIVASKHSTPYLDSTVENELGQRDFGETEAACRPDECWRFERRRHRRFIIIPTTLLGLNIIQQEGETADRTSQRRGLGKQEYVQRRRRQGQAQTSTSAGRSEEKFGRQPRCLSQPNEGRDH